jgi:hypothetical protein
MAFMDKIKQGAKNIGNKTSDAIEITKLNNTINTEKYNAKEEFKKIGEYYYNLFVEDPAKVDEAVLEFCEAAKAHYIKAEEAQKTIDNIKAESAAKKEAEKAAKEAEKAAAEEAEEDGCCCCECEDADKDVSE